MCNVHTCQYVFAFKGADALEPRHAYKVNKWSEKLVSSDKWKTVRRFRPGKKAHKKLSRIWSMGMRASTMSKDRVEYPEIDNRYGCTVLMRFSKCRFLYARVFCFIERTLIDIEGV